MSSSPLSSPELRRRNVAFSKKENENDDNDKSSSSSSSPPPPETNKHAKGSSIMHNGASKHNNNNNNNNYIVPKTPTVDRILQAYAKFTSNAFNQDKVLKVAQYSLWLISQFYQGGFKEGLVRLSGQISWARYLNRFFGFPAALEGARSGSWGNPKALGKAMAWMMILYYPLEHFAYLKWQAPTLFQSNSSTSLLSKHRFAERASALSCQCWLAYIVLDVVRSALALRDSHATASSLRSERLQIIRNALFAFPAVHWSLPNWDTNPWLSDGMVNVLMWLESVVCMYQGILNFQ